MGWLFGIARNTVFADRRRQARDARLGARVAGRALLDPASLDRLVDRLDAEREVRLLHERLQALREEDRELLELLAVDGLTVAEAAVVLGIRPGTARVRLHRLRTTLRDVLPPRRLLEVTP